MFRLYEGDYVPFKQLAQKEDAAEATRLFDSGAPVTAAQLSTIEPEDIRASRVFAQRRV